MRLRLLPLTALAFGVLGAGCEGDPHALGWEVVISVPATDVASLRMAVREGGCDGPALYDEVVDSADPSPPAPPRLTPGTYAFTADALSADCRVIGFGCSVRDLPILESLIRVDVTAAAGMTALCSPELCVDGRCSAAIDAGSLDTGVGGDAAADAATDAAADADVDADAGPTCDDGIQNGTETGVDCGGTCDACPDWDVSGWTTCESGQRSRTVTCRSFMGTEIAETACPAPKPSTSESCASVAYVGSGCPTTSQIGVLDNGACADRPTCRDCPTLTTTECRDYCLSQAVARGRRVTCDLSGCTTECNVYDGHGFDGSCSDNHATWYAFPP